MASANTLQTRLPVTRAQLQQAFPNNPQMVLAMEQVLQMVSSQGAVNATGEMVPFGGATAPEGWLICNGAAISRVTYAALFNVIQTTWGPGDGVSTFNVPNMAGRTLVGASNTIPLGSTGGSTSTVLTAAELPTTVAVFGMGELGLDSGQTGTTAVANTGGGQAVSLLPPYAAVNWLIKT